MVFAASIASLFLFFFFSSRRRHTRSLCDWSSDVCSSDLGQAGRCFDFLGSVQALEARHGDVFNIVRLQRTEVRQPVGAVPNTKDRKSTRLNSSHTVISYAVFCLKKKKKEYNKKTQNIKRY